MEQKQPIPANPIATLNLIFSILSFLTWATLTGVMGPDAALAVGIVQLLTLPSYLVAATNLLKVGDGFSGNIFSIFCCFFAGVGGITNVLSWLSATYGLPYDPMIGGILWIVIAIEFGACLPGFKSAPWYTFIMVILASTALLEIGLAGAGIAPAGITYLSGWQLFIVGCVGTYNSIVEHLATAGIKVPVGRPLFK